MTVGRDLLKLVAKAPAVVPEWRRLHMSMVLTEEQEALLERMSTVGEALEAVKDDGQILEYIP